MNTTETIAPATGAGTGKPELSDSSGIQYNTALGYLRAFIVVLVVAHHAFLAYHPYVPAPSSSFTAQPLIWAAFPIVDTQRWRGIDLFTGFNDIFFMALIFFLSGLFTWQSLLRKGAGIFFRDRLLRLGLPFVVSATLLAPLAYYPAYRVRTVVPGFADFWKQWWSLGTWPSGPAWFLWVLLTFGAVAAVLYRLAPGFGNALARPFSGASRRPFISFLLIVAASACAYIPMALAFDPMRWASFGPFSFQVCRVLHYAVYYFAGVAVCASGLERSLLAPEGKLARRWPLWIIASPLCFVLAIAAFLALLAAMSRGTVGLGLRIFVNLTFVLSCAASGFAFLSIFVRFVRRPVIIFESIKNNAYGIFLVHYAFVTWLQFAFLCAPLSGAAKGSLVFLGALALSWGATAVLRRVPGVARLN